MTPAPGARAKCDRCGRTVWLRKVGTAGNHHSQPYDTAIHQWCHRRGAKPQPGQRAGTIYCPVSDGWPTTYHVVNGLTTLNVHPDGKRNTQ